MPPVSIAIGFKADGTPVNLYTGTNTLEAHEKLQAAGRGKQCVSGIVLHNPAPHKTLDFAKGTVIAGTADDAEVARMKRINELKQLTNEDLAKKASESGVTKIGEATVDEKFIKHSIKNRMNVVVAIYDKETAANVASTLEAARENRAPDEATVHAARNRFEALKSMREEDLLALAKDSGVSLEGVVSNPLGDDDRELLVEEIMEKEFPAPSDSPENGAVTPQVSAKGLGK